jgi:hypothetical protein
MCAMLVLIAPQELRIPSRRVNRFIDAYMGSLLHVSTDIPIAHACVRTPDEAPTPHVCGLFAQVL